MAKRETWEQTSTRLPATVREALFLTAGSAIVTIIALSILKAMAFHPVAPPAAAKFVGIRHEAVTAEPEEVASESNSGAKSSGAREDAEAMIVYNGVTVLSPKLLVPVVDTEASEAATESKEASLSKTSPAARRSSHIRISRSQRRTSSVAAKRWRAYAFATR